jgi:hypothetical protein
MRLKILNFCALGALEHRLVMTLAPHGTPEEHAAIADEIQAMVDCGLLIADRDAAPGHRLLTTSADVFAGGAGRVAA